MTFRCTAMSAGHETTTATRVVLLAITLCLMSLPALAQSTAGRILGRVTDQSGATTPVSVTEKWLTGSVVGPSI